MFQHYFTIVKSTLEIVYRIYYSLNQHLAGRACHVMWMSVALEICGVYRPWLTYCINKVVLDWRTTYPVKMNNIYFGVTDCLYVVHLYRFEMKTHTYTQFTVLLWHSITLPQMVPTTCMQLATVPTSKFLCLIAPSPQVHISRHSSLMADYNLPFLATPNDVPHCNALSLCACG
jgi:hypothetical protein